MRIAILIQAYGRFGGAERLALSHFLQLKNTNADVDLFYEGPMTESWEQRIRGHNPGSFPHSVPNGSTNLSDLSAFLRHLGEYDRILIHHHIDPVLSFYLSSMYPKKVIWYSGSMFELAWEELITGLDYRSISKTVRKSAEQFYGRTISSLLLSDPLYDATVRVAQAADLFTVKRYAKVLANSEFLSNFLTRVYSLKVRPPVVYPGPDPLIEELAETCPKTDGEYILSVGPFIPLKNAAGTVAAVSQIDPVPQLVLVGEGQELASVQRLAASRGVPVNFVGSGFSESRLCALYAGCKFLVHLSLYEPFGLTPVEAGLFSKASMVTNKGGMSETVIDGETGYVVDPSDMGTVRRKMKVLLDDRRKREEMGARAQRRVKESFSIRESAKRLLGEIEET